MGLGENVHRCEKSCGFLFFFFFFLKGALWWKGINSRLDNKRPRGRNAQRGGCGQQHGIAHLPVAKRADLKSSHHTKTFRNTSCGARC